MMKGDQKSRYFNNFTSQVKSHIHETFSKYNRDVEKKNEEQIGGVMHKNDKTQKIYSSLNEIRAQLKQILKELHSCDKLRKQRRDLFEKKTNRYMNAIQHLTQDKNIRVKITSHIEKLVIKSKQNARDVLVALNKYKVQSMSLCGKSYDYKTTVEQTFLELSELAFLWENLGNFQSVTNQSVKEIFLPISYSKSDNQKLEGELIRIWNDIIATLQQFEQPPKNPSIETKIIKSDLQLAHQYLFGFTKPQQINRAIQIYQKEANKSSPDPSVFNVLGILNQQGKGFQKDMGKAFKFYMRSAERGDPEGLYKVGQYLEKGWLNFKQHFDGLYANRDAEVRGGIEYYEKAAAKGHLDALTDLGFIYEKGVIHESGLQYFIEPHPDHAKKYYQKAKQKQFPRAFNNLGNLLICESTNMSNFQENANLQKGIKYLNKGRQLGCAKASLNLGKCYLSGTGVPLNKEKARSLFKEAAELGQVQGRLEYLRSYVGTNLQEEETMTELVDTVRAVLIENRKNPEALYMMGLLQEKGIGVPASKQASFHYITSAASLEYPPAMTRLGDYYYSGYFKQKNYQIARMLYEKAAYKDDSQAYLNLALMQEKGLIPTGTSLGSTEDLYSRAEQLGNTNALLLRGLKKQSNLIHNQKVQRAAERGNYSALKMLSINEVPKMSSVIHETTSQLRKRSTFYMKQTFPSKVKFDSLL